MNFWQELPKPFFCVAPMADVTDAAFRRTLAKYSEFEKRDDLVMWTEFVAADGLMLAPEDGRQKLLADFMYTDAERPIVAQLFTSVPEHMEGACRLAAELGFDGIDINMGCPVQVIGKQGAGAAMIKDPANAKEVVKAAMRGAGDVPVSVKTRLGYNEDELESWLPAILEENPAVVTIHARTKKDMSKVPARWERVQRAVEIRDELKSTARIIGNGDVLSMEDARRKAKLSGADGVMVGRALFGNPWFFHPAKSLPTKLTMLPTHGVNRDAIVTSDTTDATLQYVTLEERLLVLVEHSKLFVKLLPFKSFNVMKKHYKSYVSGFPGAAELRGALMESSTPQEVEGVVHNWLIEHSK